jgi:hypothetical protein
MGGYAAQLQISDQRDGARHLRLSWHASRRVVVFSHWRDGVCVASTPVDVAEIPTIIGVLVKALADTSRSPTSEASAPSARSVLRDVGQILHAWLRPRLATIVALRPGSEQHRG